MSNSKPAIVPFSDPPYLCGLPSPYYNLSHRSAQKRIRTFLDKHYMPYARDWEREETVPPQVFDEFARAGMLLGNLPAPLPVQWLQKLGVHKVAGVKVEEWDYLHTGICVDEFARAGLAGPSGSMTVVRLMHFFL